MMSAGRIRSQMAAGDASESVNDTEETHARGSFKMPLAVAKDGK